jgi:hypothetical protein
LHSKRGAVSPSKPHNSNSKSSFSDIEPVEEYKKSRQPILTSIREKDERTTLDVDDLPSSPPHTTPKISPNSSSSSSINFRKRKSPNQDELLALLEDDELPIQKKKVSTPPKKNPKETSRSPLNSKGPRQVVAHSDHIEDFPQSNKNDKPHAQEDDEEVLSMSDEEETTALSLFSKPKTSWRFGNSQSSQFISPKSTQRSNLSPITQQSFASPSTSNIKPLHSNNLPRKYFNAKFSTV